MRNSYTSNTAGVCVIRQDSVGSMKTIINTTINIHITYIPNTFIKLYIYICAKVIRILKQNVN